MSTPRSSDAVLPSLLDRLIDDAPDREVDPSIPLPTRLDGLRAGVRRDLENLLNTRVFRAFPRAALPELETSVVNYGLPDFSTVVLGSSEQRDAFRDRIQRTIERYETRFRQVRVAIVPSGDEADRTLHLRITATLLIEPDPLPLRYESRVHAADRMVRLREVRDG